MDSYKSGSTLEVPASPRLKTQRLWLRPVDWLCPRTRWQRPSMRQVCTIACRFAASRTLTGTRSTTWKTPWRPRLLPKKNKSLWVKTFTFYVYCISQLLRTSICGTVLTSSKIWSLQTSNGFTTKVWRVKQKQNWFELLSTFGCSRFFQNLRFAVSFKDGHGDSALTTNLRPTMCVCFVVFVQLKLRNMKVGM